MGMVYYPIIRPPLDRPFLDQPFREMSKEELREYANWFHSIIPHRIKILEKAVKGSLGFESWKADMSPESLDPLSRWFEKQVETRKKTKEELEADRALLGKFGEPEDWTITERTASIAFDVGIYFGQVVLVNVPGAKWSQVLRGKRNFDYGKPVIIYPGGVPLEPINIIIVSAFKVARGKSANFRKLYDNNVERLKGEPFQP